MQLYKFTSISPRAITSLVTGKFWASSLDRLNDPFEDRFASAAQTYRDFAENCGVFCVSRHESDGPDVLRQPLMWAHYASNHSGIAIGLEPTRVNSGLTKMQYLTSQEIKMKTIQLIRDHKNMRDTSEQETIVPWIDIVFLFKMNFWRYENEYRWICAGAANSYVDPFVKINEIVFGFRSRPEDEIAIWSALRDQVTYRKMTNREGDLEVEDYQPKSRIETDETIFLVGGKAGTCPQGLPASGPMKYDTYRFK